MPTYWDVNNNNNNNAGEGGTDVAKTFQTLQTSRNMSQVNGGAEMQSLLKL